MIFAQHKIKIKWANTDTGMNTKIARQISYKYLSYFFICEYTNIISSPGLIIPSLLPGKINLWCTIGQGSGREQNVQFINLFYKHAGSTVTAVKCNSESNFSLKMTF